MDDYKESMKNIKNNHLNRVNKSLNEKGVIIVNTGNGKGKSTAAFGTAFRAVGHGLNVAIIQFIKGDWKTGEEEAFKNFDNIFHYISGKGFTWDTQDKDLDREAAEIGWLKAKEICLDNSCKYQLLILDELTLALNFKLLDLDDVITTLVNKPSALNIIITGRDAPLEIIKIADTVSEIIPVKHAFESGIKAQKGIDF